MTAKLKPITGMRESLEDLNGTVTEYSHVAPKVLKEPQRERLRLWFESRNRFLGEPTPESFEPETVLRGESGEPARIES